MNILTALYFCRGPLPYASESKIFQSSIRRFPLENETPILNSLRESAANGLAYPFLTSMFGKPRRYIPNISSKDLMVRYPLLFFGHAIGRGKFVRNPNLMYLSIDFITL